MSIVLSLALVALVAYRLWHRIRFMRTSQQVYFGPRLHDRIDALFDPFQGEPVTAEALARLERDAGRAFDDILTGVGLVPNGWKLQVHIDDVLGPVPRVHGPAGEVMTVADFEQALVARSVELPGA